MSCNEVKGTPLQGLANGGREGTLECTLPYSTLVWGPFHAPSKKTGFFEFFFLPIVFTGPSFRLLVLNALVLRTKDATIEILLCTCALSPFYNTTELDQIQLAQMSTMLQNLNTACLYIYNAAVG